MGDEGTVGLSIGLKTNIALKKLSLRSYNIPYATVGSNNISTVGAQVLHVSLLSNVELVILKIGIPSCC